LYLSKRLFDIVFSVIVLLLFLPIGIIIGLWITMESRGGIFFIQERIGRNGVPFSMLKFRSMLKNAEASGKLTVGMNDQRITRSGKLSRKFKLDEFPQFINVLKGDMSVVGPRPEVKEFVDLYTKDQYKILDVKPGITDFASLEYFEENKLLGLSENPKETYISVIMPAKIELNKKYLNNPNLLTDLKIIWKTFTKMLGF
jgi:lipopolysaccharide/colanic/teichoic acid biosynthesis glycosyltransferase